MPGTPESRPPTESVLGFDFGMARIGVAIAQLPEGIISPLKVVPSHQGKVDWKALTEMVREWRPGRMVVGVPTRMDGSDSEITRAARRFAQRLAHRTGVQVLQTDERLTSKAAEAELGERRRSGAGKRRDADKLDAVAARIMLEQWLYEQNANDNGNGNG